MESTYGIKCFVAIVRLQSSNVKGLYHMLKVRLIMRSQSCLSILYKFLTLLDCNLTMATTAGRNM